MGKEQRMTGGDDLKELAAQKEKEWKDLQELRSSSLEQALKEKESKLAEEQAKFLKLKEDFKYNLKLLNERDAELENYDRNFTDLRATLTKKESELSSVKIALDELKLSVEREAKAREEMQAHYQHRVREKQAEVENYRSVKEGEMQKEREQLEFMKRNLERQLAELEDELDTQKRQLTMDYEEALRKQEHKFKKQMDEMNGTVLAHEMKAKLLSRELDLVKTAQNTASQEMHQVDSDRRSLEKQLKQKDWELQDCKALKDAQIKELSQQLQSTEVAMNRTKEEFNRKHSELDRYCKEKEAALTKVKDGMAERERHLESKVRELQDQLEQAELKYRQLDWSKQDTDREKANQIDRLESELSDVRSHMESRLSEKNRDNVSRDMELESLRENEAKLKEDLLQKKQDIERYKKELQQAVERETVLERSKAQLQLDWQRRTEDVERTQYDRSEDLVKTLTQARDEAEALLKEKVRELRHKTDLITVLTEDRNCALATLKQNNLAMDRGVDPSQFDDLPKSAVEQIENLQTQNNNLRQVVHLMRAEMENLGGEFGGGETARSAVSKTTGNQSVAAEYVKNLEQDVRNLKVKCRQLEQQACDHVDKDEGHKKVMDTVADDLMVKSHIEQLNNNMGSLRSEKVELSAQLRKQQARTQYLENLMDTLSKEPREKQVQIEQLQYELAAQTRRHQAELASSQQRATNLEMQLVETRKEADEYMKANIERNTEITALGHQFSSLKMELSKERPTINFGAQEIVIQQLQDEIQHLRNQLKGQGESFDPVMNRTQLPGQTGGQGQLIGQLQNKLRLAAKQISQLAREKQQLIEVGNRLRARCNENGVRPPSPPAKPAYPPVAGPSKLYPGPTSTTRPVVIPPPPDTQQPITDNRHDLHTHIQTKLSQLETLQYQLTRQELEYQQRFGDPRVPHINVQSSMESEVEDLPKSILKKSVEFDTKLSPVPENTVSVLRPKTAPTTTTNSRPRSPARGRGTSLQPHVAHSANGNHRSSSPVKENGGMLQMSISSVGGESLNEIWRMLDDTPRTLLDSGPEGEGHPFPGVTFPGDRSGPIERPKSAGSNGSWTLKGQTSALQPKPSQEPRLSKLTPRTAGKATVVAGKSGKASQGQQKTKIRNYNVRDEKGVR